MLSRNLRCLVVLAGAFYALIPSQALAQDAVFADSFELPFNLPANDGEAARFLNQATFGATRPEINQVRQVGITTWMDQQFAVPASLHRPSVEQLTATLATGASINQDDRVRRWWQTAINGPDQLRQRTAWALQQIIVVSDQDADLSSEPILMAEWQDIMLRNAFGNYRNLLEEATRSPMMGVYLTHLRNRRLEGSITPDENFAREVMQLFSIGLIDRNVDFSPTLDIGGNPIPTYNNTTIAEVARVFTGLTHTCSGDLPIDGTGITMRRNCGTGCTGIDCRFTNTNTLFFNNPPRDDNVNNLIGTTILNRGLRHPDYYLPMVCYPRYHDIGRDSSGNLWTGNNTPSSNKLIEISGVTVLDIPASPVSANCHQSAAAGSVNRAECVNYCEGGVTSLVNALFNHPNTPTVVARTLIQRFVTANPSPDYIRRVSCVFQGTSSVPADCPVSSPNQRGDLRATVSAVLLDAEARRPVTDPLTPLNFGKPREPLLKLAQAWRSFGVVLPPLSSRTWGPNNPQNDYQQRPLGAPSVFNFFMPDYKQPGAISGTDINGSPSTTGLFSPEFQIIAEVSAVSAANDLFTRICNAYGGNNCDGAFATTPPTTTPYIPPAALDALPLTDDQALVEELNTRLMGGAMSGTIIPVATGQPCPGSGVGTGMKASLYKLVRCDFLLASPTFGSTVNDRRRKALYLMHLIAISPEFGMQR